MVQKYEDGKIELKDGHKMLEDMIKQDARFTAEEIAASAGKSLGSVHKIWHNY